jgi:hypothetical protein
MPQQNSPFQVLWYVTSLCLHLVLFLVTVVIVGKTSLPESYNEQLTSHLNSIFHFESYDMSQAYRGMFAFSYVFSNGGHLGWGPMSSNTILKGNHTRTILPWFGPDWPRSFRGEDFLIHFLLNFLFLVTVAILVGGRGRRTQFWKGTT